MSGAGGGIGKLALRTFGHVDPTLADCERTLLSAPSLPSSHPIQEATVPCGLTYTIPRLSERQQSHRVRDSDTSSIQHGVLPPRNRQPPQTQSDFPSCLPFTSYLRFVPGSPSRRQSSGVPPRGTVMAASPSHLSSLMSWWTVPVPSPPLPCLR